MNAPSPEAISSQMAWNDRFSEVAVDEAGVLRVPARHPARQPRVTEEGCRVERPRHRPASGELAVRAGTTRRWSPVTHGVSSGVPSDRATRTLSRRAARAPAMSGS